MSTADGADPLAGTVTRPPWWRELTLLVAFYVIYTLSRNQFGSAAVSPDVALRNAEWMIDAEKAIGLYVEAEIQSWFLDWTAFIQFWNLFYGTFHFIVTWGVLFWLYRWRPERYPYWRTAGLATTGLALVGFSLYPLMPPRLLGDCGEYGACLAGSPFVDTVADVGGLWSFDSGTAQRISNQYAAMPSLHFAWALWSSMALAPELRRWWTRGLNAAYPLLTVFAIVVTANHYWIDAVGGAVVLAAGFAIASAIQRRGRRLSAEPTTVTQ